MNSRRLFACALLALFLLSGCGRTIMEGTQATHYGVVVDRAMSRLSYRDWHRESRSYIGIECEDGTGKLFWLAEEYDAEGIEIGDYVRIEGAVEEKSGLLMVTEIEVLGHEKRR